MSIRDALDTALSFASAQAEFEEAWCNPNHTQFELPSMDVNKVLDARYSVNPSIRLTRSMLWDMEMKKAWDPSTYIPYVVSSGHSWGRHNLEQGCERFFRSSIQIAWISPERGQVLEEVFWPAPGSEDTELGVLMELEVGHGETEVYPRVQA